MHRHRELCVRAVDPLEIAAGLEAHGVTDRTAARYRHRDVFSLAEEMYARIARDTAAPAPPRDDTAPRARAGWILLALLPGALCAATVAGVRLTTGPVRPAVAAVGLPALALAVHVLLRRGPLGRREHPRGGPRTRGTHAWTYWLLAYAVLGDGLLGAAVPGGPDGLPDGTRTGPWPLATVPVLALALACAPACWAAHLFAVRARRALTASRGLHEFAASVRPLLLVVFTLFLGVLAALLAACGKALHEPAATVQTLALGALLLLARLLATHGSTHAPAAALAAAATAEATAQASVFAARLPGCDPLAVPVDTLVTAWGPGSIPALACGTAALTLLIHAARTLTRASAHAQAEKQP
ncbi:membrane protein [Streptomyces sp. Tu 6176]|nr:membrane protein [Streptomyces sp. Tu 6176]